MSGSGDKTEKATPKKIRDAKKKGQVPNSRDIPPALILLMATIYFWVMGDWMMSKLAELFVAIPQLQSQDFGKALDKSITIVLEVMVGAIILPFIAMTAITGVLGNIVQFGFIFTLDPLKPDLAKISPASGFKRIFSMKQIINTIFSLIKTIIIGIALLIVIRMGISELIHDINQCNLLCQKSVTADLLNTLMMIVLPIMLALAIMDFLLQKSQFEKEQRMTKEEIKREMKEMFGDPHVMGARQGLRRELSEQDIASRIKTARLLLIDIGVAIALHYEQDVTPLPVVVAIGKAGMARKMVEIAQGENVPIVSDGRLVGDMLEEAKVDQYIPASTIDRVARAMRGANKR